MIRVAVLILMLSTQAGAAGTYITGRGSSSGYCSGDFSYSCIQNISRQAEMDGEQDMRFRCQMDRGYLTIPTCNTFCSPNYIPPGSSNTYVRCDASCSGTCQK